MEVLIRYGNEEQKKEWLYPLLDGKIRSCFAMTEPAVASSDATNMKATIRQDGDELVLSGHKWWTSGAYDSRCKVVIFMGRTHGDLDAMNIPKHRRHSMVLVPMDTPGLTVIRPMKVMGFDDAPHGHAEMIFHEVRVPKSNIILGEGRGFEIAQGRLGPGRIHHCMRLIGAAECALELMCQRVTSRHAFGKALAEQGSILRDIAESRIEIDQARLLCLNAAHRMDIVGNKEAKSDIAAIKIACPSMVKRVADRAIQSFGAMGLSQDTPLAGVWTWARILQIADGPDEVHLAALGKQELQAQVPEYFKRHA
jgi:alkylation response protein AidB-like acyl-CoA dehydrogenase